MHDEDYLIVDPACEVNERGTRDKNDGNEVVNNCDLPLDLELTERVEVDDETTPYAEEDWAVQNKLKLIEEYNLINVWIVRHGCPITFQSDNGKAFVGDLTKELMKRS